MQSVVVPLFPVLCKISTVSPSGKLQASSMTDITMLNSYSITGGIYIQVQGMPIKMS